MLPPFRDVPNRMPFAFWTRPPYTYFPSVPLKLCTRVNLPLWLTLYTVPTLAAPPVSVVPYTFPFASTITPAKGYSPSDVPPAKLCNNLSLPALLTFHTVPRLEVPHEEVVP